MKKLAYWSKRNPISARLLIALGHVILVALGIFSGIATYVDDYVIPSGILYIMFIVFAGAYIFYPLRVKTAGILKYSWSRRLKHDFILVLSYSIILSSGVNQFAFNPIENQAPEPQVRLMVFSHRVETKPVIRNEAGNKLHQTIKAYRTHIKAQLKLLKADWKERKGKKDEFLGAKILLILLVLGLAFIVGAGIASLSCELSCSGQEGLAILVALLGTISIILLSVLAIRAILKMGKKPMANTSQKIIA